MKRDFGIIIVRGTFRIIPNQRLKPVPDQHPLVETDIYFDEKKELGVRMESDLVPFKPNSDIHINVIARSPDKKPNPEWLLSVQIGRLKKILRILGPRYWQYSYLRGWQLSKPEPCEEVPIRYELSFGGTYYKAGKPTPYEYNPIGIGLIDLKHTNREKPIPAPQIEDPYQPIEKAGVTYKPCGLTPIGRSWLPRLKFAGTYDDNWKKNRWPELPEDFNFAYYNSAHPDLIYPTYLTGDEEVKFAQWIQNKPAQMLTFRLPAYLMKVLLRYQDGEMRLAPLLLDTLYLDLSSVETGKQRVHITWRSVFYLYKPLRLVEARMDQPSTS